MLSAAKVKAMAGLLVPPIFTQWLVRCRRSPQEVTKPRLEYAPEGWNDRQIISNAEGWNVDSVVDAEKAKWETFRNNLQGAGPLGFSHEHTDLAVVRDVPFHNVHITYAYVIALAAHLKTNLSILDWGGGLGHYYQIAKAVMPDVSFEFHCKEVPLMAEVGRLLNPEVHWYSDESYLERSYDLVMVNGSLQYMEDWNGTLRQLSQVVKEHFFLTRLPVVEHVPSFVAIQREYDIEMLHQQFNKDEVLEFVESLGLRRVREVVVGDRPYIHGAPEQCELRGWLFHRDQV
jgi:putative methyltransferase (TIGR04325 family)